MARVGRPALAPDELEHKHELVVDGGEHVCSLTVDEAEEEEEEPGVQVLSPLLDEVAQCVQEDTKHLGRKACRSRQAQV